MKRSSSLEERVAALMNTLPYLHKSPGGVRGFERRLRLALEETAKEARESVRSQSKPEVPKIDPPFHGERFLEALATYEAHRKHSRKSLTNETRKLQYREMLEWGEDVSIAALELAVRKGWQGLFKPDSRNGNGHKASRVDIGLAATRELIAEAEAENAR
jgi:hypothetical protein